MEATARFNPHQDASVFLVSLPWTNITEPSLGLGLLKAILERNSFSAKVLHTNLFLLEFLKASTYEALSIVYALNDFLFSGILDPQVTNKQKRILRDKATDLFKTGEWDSNKMGGFDNVVTQLLTLRNDLIPKWLNKWADEISTSNAALVGCTCMFDQTIASIALGRLVKQRTPEKMFVLGGYAVRNPTGAMLVKSFPWIDAICTGEGEITIVELAKASRGQISLQQVPGILYLNDCKKIIETPTPPKINLDSNPAPNYDDFFDDTTRLSNQLLIDVTPVSLPIENSRGCWWGAKHHCVFCGIHDDDMAYRHREAANVHKTLTELREKYHMDSFHFTDYILPNKFYNTLLPSLIDEERKFYLSCEIKANVTDEQFRMLAQAGFHEVQPGIESFNSKVLKKMNKGVTAIQNVYTLKLGKKFGIKVLYNILFGFPSDEVCEYEQILTLLKKISHLDSPVTCLPVQITRYAPLQVAPEKFGISASKHEPSYEIIFSDEYINKTGFDYEDFCYYYERPFENSLRLKQLYESIYEFVSEWRKQSENDSSKLFFAEQKCGSSIVHDTRFGELKIHKLDPLATEIIALSDCPIQLAILLERCSQHYSQAEINNSVFKLEADSLIISDEGKLLSLVIPPKNSISNQDMQ